MKSGNVIVLAFFFVALLAGCGHNNPAKSSGPLNITCEVFYRATAGVPLEAAPLLSLPGKMDRHFLDFDDLSFEARFQNDPFEGQALNISITDRITGAEITKHLYQFDGQNQPRNQFIGGHGFTGLTYVFHPASSAELQYFCNLI